MNAYIRMIAKALSLGVLLASFALNSHAAGAGAKGGITAEVVGKNFGSRHLSLREYRTEKRYRVALAAKAVSMYVANRGQNLLQCYVAQA